MTIAFNRKWNQHMFLKLVLLTWAFLAMSGSAHAQLSFCNKTYDRIYVAVNYHRNTDGNWGHQGLVSSRDR